MELSERQIKQIVRVIMPELYEMQAGCDKWYDIIAELCRESESRNTSEQQEAQRYRYESGDKRYGEEDESDEDNTYESNQS